MEAQALGEGESLALEPSQVGKQASLEHTALA